jgi:WD40 repeat protein
MTNDVRSDMPDAFERALAARLAAHAAAAAGPPSNQAVARAVATGPRAVRAGVLRRGAWPPSRLLVLAGVALVSASFLAGLIAGRFLERDDKQPVPSPTALANLGEPGPLIFSAEAPGDLFMWDPATQQFQRVAGNSNAQLSPDGRWAVYDQSCTQCPLLIVETGVGVPVRSGHPTFDRVEFPAGGGFRFGPSAWSPDGTSFAREAAGSLDVVDIADAAASQNPGSRLPVRSIDVASVGFASGLAWSPDGSTIALITESGDIAVVDVARGSLRTLTTGGSFLPDRLDVSRPLFWSPDGATLLSADGVNVVTVDVASGATSPVASAQADAVLGWSPDGRVVLDEPGGSDAEVLRVGAAAGPCRSVPAWSPQDEGAQVVAGDLIVGIGGADLRTVARGLCRADTAALLTWSPTGAWLAVTVLDSAAAAPAHARTIFLVPADGGQPIVYAVSDRIGPLIVRWPPARL